MSSIIKEKYTKEAVPAIKEQFGLPTGRIPKIVKVTINTGLSTKRDPKFIETMVDTLERISGQKPVVTKARKSIAGFKLREGMPTGASVTLRGPRMWSFLDKLVNVTFPRVRDFRGIEEKTVDRSGNLNVGFKEHIAFPEVEADAIESIHGLQVNVTTSTDNREEGLALFKLLGFPFKK